MGVRLGLLPLTLPDPAVLHYSPMVTLPVRLSSPPVAHSRVHDPPPVSFLYDPDQQHTGSNLAVAVADFVALLDVVVA